MPKKICLGQLCNRLVNMKEKYCPSCAEIMSVEKREKNRRYDQCVREDDIVKFYHSSAWKKVREAVLIRDNYLCQHCLKDNIIKSAEIVHHIVEVKDDWLQRFDMNNCEGICKQCHNSLHNQVRKLKIM